MLLKQVAGGASNPKRSPHSSSSWRPSTSSAISYGNKVSVTALPSSYVPNAVLPWISVKMIVS